MADMEGLINKLIPGPAAGADAKLAENAISAAAEAKPGSASSQISKLNNTPTREDYLALNPIDFKVQSAHQLSPASLATLKDQLSPLKEGNLLEVRLEVVGGKDNGPATTARREAIKNAVEEILGRPVKVEYCESAEAGSLHVISPHLYITRSVDPIPVFGSNPQTVGAATNPQHQRSVFSDYTASVIATTDGGGIRISKKDSPWSADLQTGGNGVGVAVTKDLGSKEVAGMNFSLRAGPYVKLGQKGESAGADQGFMGASQQQNGDAALDIGGQISLEKEGQGRIQPKVDLRVGTGGIGIGAGVKIKI